MTILEKLKKYFEENSEEQILKDWEETKSSDCVNSPTVEQFLLYNVGCSFCKHPKSKLTGLNNGFSLCGKCNEIIKQQILLPTDADMSSFF